MEMVLLPPHHSQRPDGHSLRGILFSADVQAETWQRYRNAVAEEFRLHWLATVYCWSDPGEFHASHNVINRPGN